MHLDLNLLLKVDLLGFPILYAFPTIRFISPEDGEDSLNENFVHYMGYFSQTARRVGVLIRGVPHLSVDAS